ncbi:MAG: tRNA (adenosine(37)-N6)-threonylcarbamoyltransferase complex dimerization subunit type 1 TsaB [Parvibaculum sp.]|nr:tRNA (adenosine(37)-N6)-threonylcarbamoyltransferase complex dimerization subunit type 1 TsaB [Parvibaculum sp.]
MILLAFDTAQGALSAAIMDGEGVLVSSFEPRTRGHAEALMPLLETMLAEAALGFADLDALAVTVGPGTFTGLRVGLAAARGLALARSLPLVGVTTLEAVAEPAGAEADETCVALFDARRDEVYMQAFSSSLAPLTPPLLVALDEAPAHLPEGKAVLVGTGAELLGARLEAEGRPFRLSPAKPQPEAQAVGRIALARIAAQGLGAFRVAPEPLYIRAPDAKLPGGRDPEAA